MEKLNLIFYQFDREMAFIDTICKDLEKKGEFEISFVNDYSELGQITSEHESMIVVFRLIESHDLAQTVGTLQATKEKYKEGLFRAICIQQKPAQRKVERLLRNLGCNEFFDTNTNPRTIRFKIDFLGRGIKAAIKQKEQKEKQKARAAAGGREEQKAEEEVKINFVRPVTIDSDIWILKENEDYKKVLGRWLFHLIGPSSRVGYWEYIESRDKDINGTWKFMIEPEFKGKFVTEEGAWFFKGNRPEFDWKTARWKFSSQEPHLFFKPQEGDLSFKLKLDDKNLFISKNSEAAMLKEKEILETCDGRFAVNKDKREDSNEMSYMDRMAKEKEGNLQGKGNSEEAASNLKGKNSSEEESGPLKGKSKTGLDEKSDQEEAERKGFKEESDNDLSGKGSKSDNIDGHLKGKSKTGLDEKSDQEEAERKGFKEESDNDLSGKGSKSDNIDGHLKGGVKKDQKEVEESKDKAFADDTPEGKELEITEDEISDGSVEGKIKKDKAHQGELKGSLKKEEDEAKEEEPQSNKTDNIDGHLKGGVKKDQKEAEENKDKAFTDDTPEGKELEITEDEISDGSVEGKIKKDKAHQGELKGGVKNQEAAKKDMDGHGEVDDIDGHFRNKEKYNADNESEVSDQDVNQEKTAQSSKAGDESGDFIDQKEEENKEDNIHSLNTDKVAAQLKGKITPEKEEPVSLESGEIETSIKINNEDQKTNFEDILEEELYLQLEKNKAKVGDPVNFSISFSYGNEKIELQGSGSVGEVEPDEDFDFVIIDIEKVDKKQLDNFLELYSKRQESINKFLSLAKGA